MFPSPCFNLRFAGSGRADERSPAGCQLVAQEGPMGSAQDKKRRGMILQVARQENPHQILWSEFGDVQIFLAQFVLPNLSCNY